MLAFTLTVLAIIAMLLTAWLLAIPAEILTGAARALRRVHQKSRRPS